MPKPLDERIAAFMTNGARTADVAALIDELDGVIADTRAESERQDSLSKSATVTEDEAEAAADEAAKLGRKLIRLEAKRQQLRERHEELLNSERAKRARAEREAALQRRDELAEEIKQRWPVLCDEIVGLLDRIKASDDEIAQYCEMSAEAVARGCSGTFMSGASQLSRFTAIKLPSLTGSGNDQMAWPRQKNFFAATEAMHRAQLIQREAEKRREAERWKSYVVTAPDDSEDDIAIDTKQGQTAVRGTAVVMMSPVQVERARATGCMVRLARSSESVGQPANVASY